MRFCYNIIFKTIIYLLGFWNNFKFFKKFRLYYYISLENIFLLGSFKNLLKNYDQYWIILIRSILFLQIFLFSFLLGQEGDWGTVNRGKNCHIFKERPQRQTRCIIQRRSSFIYVMSLVSSRRELSCFNIRQGY